jgi:flagellar protein FlaI
MLRTKVDEFVGIVRKKPVSLGRLSKELGISINAVEGIGRMLEKSKVVEIHYPINPFQKPFVAFRGLAEEEKKEKKKKGTVLESYELVVDDVPAKVAIIKEKGTMRYDVEFISLELPTKIFLDNLRDELSTKMPISQPEVSDIERLAKVKEGFTRIIRRELENYELGEDVNRVFSGLLLHNMFGLGDIELLTDDKWLEEIAINDSKTPIAVYHRKLGWMETNMYIPSEEEIFNYASQIGRKVGRQIAVLTPILDARLETGDRVTATLSPISSHGNTITIRKFARDPWTIVSLIKSPAKTMTPEMAAFLWQAIHYELNIMVAGGTASGKTSTLNALCAFIPPNQRIVTIEDTRELLLPKNQWNWIPLVTRSQNPEGMGEVGMLDLMVASLRMRPDRMVVGEMRKKRQAEVLFEAMHTGHAVYSTMHADTSGQVIRRLTQPPFEIPNAELEALHLLLVQYRDRRKNLRRTLEISEIVAGTEGRLSPTIIYRWRTREDTFDKVTEPARYYSEINLHTGLTKPEIDKDLKERATILRWMVKRNISNIDDVGKVMSAYYSDPQLVYNYAAKNRSFKTLVVP